jgi:hypothetical protein
LGRTRFLELFLAPICCHFWRRWRLLEEATLLGARGECELVLMRGRWVSELGKTIVRGI